MVQFTDDNFMKHPIIKALLDVNILYKSKYFDYLYVEHSFYWRLLDDYVLDKLVSFN